jgi:hypothetical protein
MSKNQASVIAVIAAVWHAAAIIKDAERYQANWARWQATPTAGNLIRLLVAEGILVRDIGWLA